ncbi:MAG TPA: mechanosensitive ion channel domain-containing protein [Cyclobacteriaceae bacterium]|nr:mechanosensitive ion channel domain-containing protein [Cyclobacteriaceae bacterium]
MWEAISKLEYRFSPTGWNILVIAGSITIGLIIKTIVHWTFSYYTKRSDYYLFKAVTKYLHAPASVLIPLLTLNAALPLIDMSGHPAVQKTIELALIAAFSFLLIRVVKVFEDLVYFRNDIKAADNLKARKIRTQIKFISRMLIVIIGVLAVSAMLLSFESLRKIGTGLLAGVGVGGIIIGFAAQSTLSNLLAGFQIAFTQPIRIEDVVVVEGEWGIIEDITLTYVVVKIWDERRLVLPINYFITKPFQNWTRVNSNLLATVLLYLDYSTPIELLRKKFDSLLAENKLWDGKVKAIQVTDSTERVMEVRALMSARNSSDAFDLRCFVREQLISYIQTEYPESLPKTRSEAILAQQKDIVQN